MGMSNASGFVFAQAIVCRKGPPSISFSIFDGRFTISLACPIENQ
jgi:hypothetical protein